MPFGRRWCRAAAVVPLLAVVGGCDDDANPAPVEIRTPSLSTTVLQYRPDEGTRRISIEVTNVDESQVRVVGVTLHTSAFQPLPATPKDTVFAPGQTIALATTYGDPRCRADDTTTDAVAVMTLSQPTGTMTTDVPVSEAGQAWLSRLHRSECQQAALDAVVDVELPQAWRRVVVDGYPYLRGALTLRRTPDAPAAAAVTVTATRGSVLLDLRPVRPGRPVGELAPGQAVETIPVLLGSSQRCDAHALGGSTQTFLLSAFVRRQGEPQQRVVLIPDATAKRKVLRVVAAACDVTPG